jgi:hypothetical protein
MLGPGPTFPTGPGGPAGAAGPSSGYVGRDLVWVDLRFSAGGAGNEQLPFNTANIGLSAVPDGGTLLLAGGDASTEPGVNIAARNLNARGLSGQSGSGGLGAVLPTLTYAITTGTQRLAFQNISVALVHSGTAASLTQCYFEFCPTVTLTAGGDSPPVYWAGDAACTLSGSGGQLYFDGGNLAGYTANTGGITARSGNITGGLTSPTSILILGGCTFSAVSLTAPSITMDLASHKAAQTAGVSFSSPVHVLVATGTPVDIGTANAAGSGPALANFDHVHNLPFSATNASLAAANATINVNNQRITGLAAPTVGSDAVTKTYADAIAVGLKVKTAAVAVATANQATMSGTAQTIDGVALNTIGQRVLLTAQTTATQNGLWVIAAGAWTRPADFATGSGAAQSYVPITGGTLWAGSAYFDTNTAGSDVVDTNNLTWTLFSQAAIVTAGAGLTKTGNTLDVVAGDATIVVHADDLVVGVIGNANLADNTIALARLANAGAQNDFLMRKTAGSGAWEDATLAQAQAALGITTSGTLKSVRAATTANITLSGTQTVDGVALVAADRCLVKNQTTGANNGVYAVASGAWTRTTDAASAGQLFGGLLVPISEGTANGNQVAQLTTDDPVTIGSTSLTFAMGRVAALGSVAPQDITDGAAQIGTSQFGTPIDHVHHLGFTALAAVLAVASASIAVNSQKITGLATCTVSADAANKGYVDSAISTALGAPANPADNGKVAYANAGVLAYAAGVTTSAGANLSVTSTASTGTVASTFKVTDAAHTTLTASTERISALFDFGQTRQFATGALTTQRALRVIAPTYSFVGASTITTAATVAISGAPVAGTNATITNSLALWLESGGIGIGTAIARQGAVRFAPSAGTSGLWWRNNADNQDLAGLFSGTDDVLYAGDPTNGAGVNIRTKSSGFMNLYFGATAEYQLSPTAFNFTDNIAQFGSNPSANAAVNVSNNRTVLGGKTSGGNTAVILSWSGANDITIGDNSTNTNDIYLVPNNAVHVYLGAVQEYLFTTTYFDFTNNQARFGSNPSTIGLLNFTNNSTVASGRDSGGTDRNLLAWTSSNHLTVGSGLISVDVVAQANTWAFGATAAFPGVEHNIASSGFLSFGTASASGLVRAPNNVVIVTAKSATSGDLSLLSTDGADELILGATNVATILATVTTGGYFAVNVNTTTKMTVDTTTVDVRTNRLKMDNTGTIPTAPASGGYLYVEGGTLKWISSTGRITSMGFA